MTTNKIFPQQVLLLNKKCVCIYIYHFRCKHYDYPQKMPVTSVIIVFHNEGWSPLMRAVHNVINNTPKELLHEVVMIDDGSKKGKYY